MTTLVASRRPLEVLSMSNQAERRPNKRLAASGDIESDDDFKFVRKSKRAKTEEAPEPVKRSTRGRPAASKSKEAPPATRKDDDIFYTKTSTAAGRKPSRRKASPDASIEEPQPKVPKRATRKSTRRAAGDDAEEAGDVLEEPRASGAAMTRPASKKGKATRSTRAATDEPSHHEPSVASSKITLPMSDTPIINRNKEMRKKGGSTRRSSLGSRGRRASSLIENGQTAIPHREVNPAEFYKHIECDGLPEPRRMKQLLTWCGERSLVPKPPHGAPNPSAHMARAIQDQLLKDFGNRSEFSDWFSRDDSAPAAKATILKPNPLNHEMDEKMTQLSARIKRLQEEKKAWLAIQKPPAELPALFPETTSQQIILPDFDLLDAPERPIRASLADEAFSSAAIRTSTSQRLRAVQSSLEFQIDQLADNVHKLEMRVSVAGREADEVLKRSAERLREREEQEKMRTRTKEMPLMEVLRSLSNILPEGGG
ncbi:hypothetical protein CC79DRAFT_1336647 [Sarocladium strictum]